MKIKNPQYLLTAVRPDQYPEKILPAITFLGRSNVGKSSLINTLTGRKRLARTSSQPGKTRTINFYDIDGAWYLVDLPGYGFAKVSRDERNSWKRMIEQYMNKYEGDVFYLLLVDIRHATSENDRQMFDWMKYMGFDPVIIATKLDKIKRSQVNRQIKVIREGLGADGETIIVPFSAQTKQGRETIWDFMDQVIENESENA